MKVGSINYSLYLQTKLLSTFNELDFPIPFVAQLMVENFPFWDKNLVDKTMENEGMKCGFPFLMSQDIVREKWRKDLPGHELFPDLLFHSVHSN